jgi:hypothetical protein
MATTLKISGVAIVSTCSVLRHHPECLGIGDDLRQIDRLLADSACHDVANCRLGDKAEAHQEASDRNIAASLFSERDCQLIGADQSLLYQQLSQPQLLAKFRHPYSCELSAVIRSRTRTGSKLTRLRVAASSMARR